MSEAPTAPATDPRRSATGKGQVDPGTTRFTVRGSRNGSLVEVTWERGVLTGDFPTCDLIEVQAAMARGAQDDPTFGRLIRAQYGALPDDPLADPQAAYRVVEQVIDAIRDVAAVNSRASAPDD